MKASEAKVIIDAIQGLVDGEKPKLGAFDARAPRLVKPAGEPDAPPAPGAIEWKPNPESIFEDFYQRVKNRLLDECQVDPVLLHLLTTRPEIVVDVEPRRMTLEGSSLKGRIARLMVAKFFDEPRRQNQVRSELMRTGTEPNSGGLSTAISDFVKDGFLVRDSDSYTLAPGVRVTEKEVVAA